MARTNQATEGNQQKAPSKITKASLALASLAFIATTFLVAPKEAYAGGRIVKVNSCGVSVDYSDRHSERRVKRYDRGNRTRGISRRNAQRPSRRQADRRVDRHTHRHADRISSCGCRERYVAGFYRTEYKSVQDPGYYEKVWVPARFGFRWECGIRIRVCLNAGYYKRVYREGRCRRVKRKIWVSAHYDSISKCRRHNRGHRH